MAAADPVVFAINVLQLYMMHLEVYFTAMVLWPVACTVNLITVITDDYRLQMTTLELSVTLHNLEYHSRREIDDCNIFVCLWYSPQIFCSI